MSIASSRGFSLVEALVAVTIAATAVVSLSQLLLLAAGQTVDVRRRAAALMLAQGKLDELRSLSWSFAVDGTRLSDPQLSASPDDALLVDRAGYVDAVDGYVRRWAVSPFESTDADTLVLRACVYARGREAAGSLVAADACVVGLLVRRA
jgi:type II secretory pathway pseudopilin PulG